MRPTTDSQPNRDPNFLFHQANSLGALTYHEATTRNGESIRLMRDSRDRLNLVNKQYDLWTIARKAKRTGKSPRRKAILHGQESKAAQDVSHQRPRE